MLEKGAAVDALDNLGRTSLHRASFQNNTEAIKLLLKHHADVTLRSEYDQTALDIARGRNNAAAINILKDYGRT